MQYIPEAFWLALSGLLGAITVHLTHKIRQRRRPSPGAQDELKITEKLRIFVDDRAAHKANNAVGPIVLKVEAMQKDLTRVEGDLKNHMERTQKDVHNFYLLTGELTVKVEGVRSEVAHVRAGMVKQDDKLDALLVAVGRLEGAIEGAKA